MDAILSDQNIAGVVNTHVWGAADGEGQPFALGLNTERVATVDLSLPLSSTVKLSPDQAGQLWTPELSIGRPLRTVTNERMREGSVTVASSPKAVVVPVTSGKLGKRVTVIELTALGSICDAGGREGSQMTWASGPHRNLGRSIGSHRDGEGAPGEHRRLSGEGEDHVLRVVDSRVDDDPSPSRLRLPAPGSPPTSSSRPCSHGPRPPCSLIDQIGRGGGLRGAGGGLDRR